MTERHRFNPFDVFRKLKPTSPQRQLSDEEQAIEQAKDIFREARQNRIVRTTKRVFGQASASVFTYGVIVKEEFEEWWNQNLRRRSKKSSQRNNS